jgi:alpha-L-rhamnosidase
VRPQPGSVEWAGVTLPTLKGRIGAAFRSVEGRTDVGVDVPGNTGATVYVPAGDSPQDDVYVDGRPVPASRERGYLRVDRVPTGCHVLSTARGHRRDDDRLTSICN